MILDNRPWRGLNKICCFMSGWGFRAWLAGEVRHYLPLTQPRETQPPGHLWLIILRLVILKPAGRMLNISKSSTSEGTKGHLMQVKNRSDFFGPQKCPSRHKKALRFSLGQKIRKRLQFLLQFSRQNIAAICGCDFWRSLVQG